MSEHHLSEEELDAVLIGAGLPTDRAAHLSGCVACRSRRDGLSRVLGGSKQPDPGRDAMAAAREGALEDWQRDTRGRHGGRWWLAVAAAILLMVLLPLIRSHAPRTQATFDAGAVLHDVDSVLDRDPLTAVASDAVVQTLAPGTATDRQGGA